jgi:hypothetical protein
LFIFIKKYDIIYIVNGKELIFMSYIKGFVFANGERLAITRKLVVEDYGQAHQLLSALGARHYLITLIEEE